MKKTMLLLFSGLFLATSAVAQTTTTEPVTTTQAPSPTSAKTAAPDNLTQRTLKKRAKGKAKEVDLSEAKQEDVKKEETPTVSEDLFKSLDYPELQVVPRATERLQLEVQNESEMNYFTHWPLQVSALATLAFGLTGKVAKEDASEDQKKELNLASTGAIGVGAFWLITTGVISWQKPYASGLNKVRRVKGNDRKAELLRERIAEEALESPAKTMKTLTTLSVISNVLAVGYLAGYANDSVLKTAVAAGILAFTPWVFEHRYIESWDKQLEYKRKIYSPVSALTLGYDQKARQYYPQMSLRWEF